jgi:hypothetical protein
MLEYQRLRREINAATASSDSQPMPRRPLPSRAARAQARGLCGLDKVSRSLSKSSLSSDGSMVTGSPSTPAPSETELAAREQRTRDQDSLVIETELERYRAASTIHDVDELMDFDILVFWQVSVRQLRLSTFSLTNSTGSQAYLSFTLPHCTRCSPRPSIRSALRTCLFVWEGD